jgi:hypothetical protein
MLVLFTGHWTSSRAPDPYGCWEYLHQGRGRGIHQENLELLSRLEPVHSQCTTTNQGSYCPRSTYSASAGVSPNERNSESGAGATVSNSSGSASGSSKISAGRRIANLFIESGKADVSGLRQWITAKPELRQEFEALLYSKRFKEVVEEAIGLVSEDFRLSNWKALLESSLEHCTFDDSYYDIDTSVVWLGKILAFNNIDKDKFFEDVMAVMDKSVIKINTIWFYGPSNAGKSLVANSIVESARFYANIMDFDERTSFPLNDAPGKRVILINEPDIGERRIELVKNIMEGQDVAINVKNQRGVTLPRTPLVFCSNKTLWHFCLTEANAIMNRCYMYTFATYDELIHCKKKLHPLLWTKLFDQQPTDMTKQLLNSVIFHRNMKSEMFSMNDNLLTLLKSNLDLTTKPFDTVHLSVKPSCELCELSTKIIQLYDPVGDVSECLTCGFPTQYVFCTQCIDEIHN